MVFVCGQNKGDIRDYLLLLRLFYHNTVDKKVLQNLTVLTLKSWARKFLETIVGLQMT